jgi:hypothetical protein
MDKLTFDFDLSFLNAPNWELLYKLSAERFANEQNALIRDLWRGIELEAGYRSRGSDQHATIVIQMSNIPAHVATRSIEILGEVSNVCAAPPQPQFRAVAFFVELIQEITRAVCGVTDEQKKSPN